MAMMLLRVACCQEATLAAVVACGETFSRSKLPLQLPAAVAFAALHRRQLVHRHLRLLQAPCSWVTALQSVLQSTMDEPRL